MATTILLNIPAAYGREHLDARNALVEPMEAEGAAKWIGSGCSLIGGGMDVQFQSSDVKRSLASLGFLMEKLLPGMDYTIRVVASEVSPPSSQERAVTTIVSVYFRGAFDEKYLAAREAVAREVEAAGVASVAYLDGGLGNLKASFWTGNTPAAVSAIAKATHSHMPGLDYRITVSQDDSWTRVPAASSEERSDA